MIFYRGKGHSERETELQRIIEHAENKDGQNKVKFQRNLQVIKSPAFLRPLRCVGLLRILECMSGFPILLMVTHTFLEVQKYIAMVVFINQLLSNSLHQRKKQLH